MATLDWISLAEAKAALNISATTHDTEVALYVTAVSRRLDQLVGGAVIRTLTGETHDGGKRWVDLAYRPVQSVTTVVEYAGTVAQTLTAETTTTQTANSYVVGNVFGELRRRASGYDAAFPGGRRNVVVTYVAGRYADTVSVAEHFKLAATIFLSHLWRREQGAGTVTFGGVDDAGLGIPTFGIPNVVKDLLSDDLAPPVVA